ncbi:phage tail protein [Oceanobacillus kimchii]|uniref:major tail protein n=1 Tax=Oceanobacillus kimchii TaxID=746691 RepID=UPI0021A46470|nr:major tail protein [Oceanobacillus kimchii]MCT1577535.1 phage tail protein [Oceanobacillus kimchii]MCT2136523.1 phage tail protein [Oceanobacillus kimchii]
MPEKNYKSSTGVDGFYYGIIGDGTVAETVERVKFLQTITVEMPQEPVRAHGDNITAEMAINSGDISITAGFHKIPLEDKQKLLGWEVVEGITATSSNDSPPYVGVIFTKTFQDGSREYVGLPKGMFTRPNVTANSKGESTEFSSEEIAAQFMDRTVEGFDEEKSALFAYDEPGETTNRDALFIKIFGVPHPDAGTPSEPEGA